MKVGNFPSLTIWQKLVLVILLMALPATPLIYFFFESRNDLIEGAVQESTGLEYLNGLRQLHDALATHRDATQALLVGDSSFSSAVENTKSKVTSAIQTIDGVDSRAGANWETTAKWNAIKNNWAGLAASQNPDREQVFARHTVLIASVLQLSRTVADKSGLTTDPKLDAFYLLDALSAKTVPAIETLSQARALGTAMLARGSASPEEIAHLQFLARQITLRTEEVEQSVQSLDRYNAEIARTLVRDWRSASQLSSDVAERLSKLLSAQTTNPGPSPVESKIFFDQASRAIRDHATLYADGSSALASILSSRISTLSNQRLLQLAVVMVVLAVAAMLVISISRGIAKQTDAISTLFNEISSGNLNARAVVLSNDELGEVAKELNLMLDDILQLVDSREEKETIQRNIMKLLDEVSGVASGDLTRDAEVTSDVTGAIADKFNYMLAELRQIIASVQNTTVAVNGSVTDVQVTASQLSIGSKTQSNAIGHASSAIAEMARSIQGVSQSAATAAEIAQRAVADAKGGAATVGKTIDGMNAIRGRVQETSKRIKRLGESSQEIGEIVRLIGDIADRTGILALNASIQASTAGEAGKGFAVVAEEVERLSVRAAESTRKIAALIKSVQGDTTEAMRAMEETTREVVGGSQLANEAGQRLRDIEHISQEMASLIAGISEASKQQAAGSEEVAKNVEGISQFTQQTASGAQMTEEATKRLAELARELNASISRFKLPTVRLSEDMVRS